MMGSCHMPTPPSDWIPVGDRLPEADQFILVWSDGVARNHPTGLYVAEYYGDEGFGCPYQGGDGGRGDPLVARRTAGRQEEPDL